MRAGRLDRFITIEQPTVVQDDYGEEIETWTTFKAVWAEKVDIKTRERFQASQDIAEETTRFRMRYLEGVTPKMRINHMDKLYDIEGIAELGRGVGLEITATARAD